MESAVPFCERLTGTPAARFRFAGLDLASAGPFLLFGVLDEAATLGGGDLEAAVLDGVESGAELIAAPRPTPNGYRAVLRHPDGAVYEYVVRAG